MSESLTDNDDTQYGYRQPQPLGIHRVAQFLNSIGTAIILGLLVLVNADVVGRNLFDQPVRGTTEMVTLLIVAVVFLQLPYAIWSGGLPRAELFSDQIASRGLRLRLFAVFHLLGALMCALFTVALVPELVFAWTIGDFVGAMGDFTAPVWPVRLVQVVSVALAAILFLALAIANLRSAGRAVDD